jgi:hypothetical protein
MLADLQISFGALLSWMLVFDHFKDAVSTLRAIRYWALD